MFEIFVDGSFSAGHHLRNYPGNCEKPHGHNWKVRIAVQTNVTDELGMAIDFRDLKKIMHEALASLDHEDLNQHPAFQEQNPSSEHLAVYIYNQVVSRLGNTACAMKSVTVHETDANGVTYHGPTADSCCR